MIKTASLLTVFAAVAAAAPALANSAVRSGGDALTNELARTANELEARKFLASRGYVATSEFRRGSNGELIGTALKNGVPVMVVHKMPPRIINDVPTN